MGNEPRRRICDKDVCNSCPVVSGDISQRFQYPPENLFMSKINGNNNIVIHLHSFLQIVFGFFAWPSMQPERFLSA
jgi:hypothetical protein